MSPLPELNLNLGLTNNPGSPFYGGNGEEGIIVRTDSAMKKHTITLVISDQEVGKILLKINDQELEVPTYKLTVTDDKTDETNAYQITRDTLNFVTSKTRSIILERELSNSNPSFSNSAAFADSNKLTIGSKDVSASNSL
jgi:hypothetical protein